MDLGQFPAVISSVIAGAVAIHAAREARRGAKETATAAPYDKLAARTDALEVEVQRLSRILVVRETEVEVLAQSVEEIVAWQEAGSPPPPPVVSRRALQVLKDYRRAAQAEVDKINAEAGEKP